MIWLMICDDESGFARLVFFRVGDSVLVSIGYKLLEEYKWLF
ncbi:hypothetical protein Hanom_Chr17g01568341 [Helianthus anomalus]